VNIFGTVLISFNSPRLLLGCQITDNYITSSGGEHFRCRGCGGNKSWNNWRLRVYTLNLSWEIKLSKARVGQTKFMGKQLWVFFSNRCFRSWFTEIS